MKKIINGRQYDTEKARYIGRDEGGDGISGWSEELHQKRTGEFFLHGAGGAMTKYAKVVGPNEWSGGEKIIPLSMDAARKWVEQHLSADDYEAIFGLPDAGHTTISAQLPAELVARARQKAQAQGTSLTAVLEAALNKYV